MLTKWIQSKQTHFGHVADEKPVCIESTLVVRTHQKAIARFVRWAEFGLRREPFALTEIVPLYLASDPRNSSPADLLTVPASACIIM